MTEVLNVFFSVKDVAAHLGMSAHFIYRQINSGALEHYVLGGSAHKKGRIRISSEQLQHYLNNQKSQSKDYVFKLPVTTWSEHCAKAEHEVSRKLTKLLGNKGKRKI